MSEVTPRPKSPQNSPKSLPKKTKVKKIFSDVCTKLVLQYGINFWCSFLIILVALKPHVILFSSACTHICDQKKFWRFLKTALKNKSYIYFIALNRNIREYPDLHENFLDDHLLSWYLTHFGLQVRVLVSLTMFRICLCYENGIIS